MNSLDTIERALIEACIETGQSKQAREQAIARRDFGQIALRYYRDANGGIADTGSLVTAAQGMAYALAILLLASPKDHHSALAAAIFAAAERQSALLGEILGCPWITGNTQTAEAST